MVRALRQCASITPVIVMSSMSIGDKIDGARDIARILSSLFSSVQDYTAQVEGGQLVTRSAFNYVFTKFTDEQLAALRNKLMDKVSKQAAGPVRALLLDMANQAGGWPDDADVSLLCEGSISGGQEIMHLSLPPSPDELEGLIERLIESRPITNPQEVVQDFTVNDSLASMLQCFTSFRCVVGKSLLCTDGSAVPLLNYKLSLLRLFSTVARVDESVAAYMSCVGEVFAHIAKLKSDVEGHMGRFSAAGTSSVADLEDGVSKLFQLLCLEETRRTHWSEATGFANISLSKFVMDKLGKTHSELGRRVCLSGQHILGLVAPASVREPLQSMAQDLIKMKAIRDKASVAFSPEVLSRFSCDNFIGPLLVRAYDEACQCVQAYAEKVILVIEVALTSKQFFNCVDPLGSLKIAASLFVEPLDATGFSVPHQYESCVNKFEKALGTATDTSSKDIMTGSVTSADVASHGPLRALFHDLGRIALDADFRSHPVVVVSLERLCISALGYVAETEQMFSSRLLNPTAQETLYGQYPLNLFADLHTRLQTISLLNSLPNLSITQEKDRLNSTVVNLLRSYRIRASELIRKLLDISRNDIDGTAETHMDITEFCNELKYFSQQLYCASVLGFTEFEDFISPLLDYILRQRIDAKVASPRELHTEDALDESRPPAAAKGKKPYLSIGFAKSVRDFAKPFWVTTCLMRALEWTDVEHELVRGTELVTGLSANAIASGAAVVTQLRVVHQGINRAVKYVEAHCGQHSAAHIKGFLENTSMFSALKENLTYIRVCFDNKAFFSVGTCGTDELDIAACYAKAENFVQSHLLDLQRSLLKYRWIKVTEEAPAGLEQDSMDDLRLTLQYLTSFEQVCRDRVAFESSLEEWRKKLEVYFDDWNDHNIREGCERIPTAIIYSVQLLSAVEDFTPGEKKFKILWKQFCARFERQERELIEFIQQDIFDSNLRTQLNALESADPEKFQQHVTSINSRIERIAKTVHERVEQHFKSELQLVPAF